VTRWSPISLPADARGANIGVRQALDAAGAFLGPLLAVGLMALTADRFRVVFWLAVPPAFLSVALLIFGVREPARTAPSAFHFSLHAVNVGRLGTEYWLVVAIAAVSARARFSVAFLRPRPSEAALNSKPARRRAVANVPPTLRAGGSQLKIGRPLWAGSAPAGVASGMMGWTGAPGDRQEVRGESPLR
jgi:hypothetical protein